jgi:hypothetical protein
MLNANFSNIVVGILRIFTSISMVALSFIFII